MFEEAHCDEYVIVTQLDGLYFTRRTHLSDLIVIDEFVEANVKVSIDQVDTTTWIIVMCSEVW